MAGARLGGEISRDLGLRLTALRETFEECGLLVVRGKAGQPPPQVRWTKAADFYFSTGNVWTKGF